MSGSDFVAQARKDSWLRATARKIGRRWLALRFRNFNPDTEPMQEAKVAGLRLRVLPEVFNPALHFTSAFFARYLRKSGVVKPGGAVFDLGTGSGVLAISAALEGAGSVLAVDINPAAAESAAINAKRYGLDSIIEVREGDMFEPVFAMRFDLVVCNPPYLRGEPSSIAGYAYWGGQGLEWLLRFGEGLHDHLAASGSCIISIGDVADLQGILKILAGCGWEVKEVARRDILFEIIHLFSLTESPGWTVVENDVEVQA